MATISEALTTALQHHRAGRLEAAEQIYRQILQAEPNQADALHLLGVMAHQVGRHEAAIESMTRAIGLMGDVPDLYLNLAKPYHALRRIPEAADCYRRALELNPDLAEAHHNLGSCLFGEGKIEEAAVCFRRAVKLRPDYVEAQNNLGNAYKAQGKLEEAIACYGRAVELGPGLAMVHNNLGLAYKDQGKREEAVACYRRALTLNPDFAEVHNNLGLALNDQGKPEEAEACCRRALALEPRLAVAHNNLGNAFKEQGKLEEAIASYRRALELKPALAEAQNNLGVVSMLQGNPEEAVASYRRVLELKPDYAVGRLNLAVALLYLGRFEEAWAQYEARLALFPPRKFSAPRWNLEPAEGKTILLHCEQGFGDSLQFLRYAALVRQRTRAKRVLLECQPKLARLFARSCHGEMEIIARGSEDDADTARPGFDWHLPLLSLPLALGMVEPLTMSGPYLRADPEPRAIWRDRLGPNQGLRVGLAWRGNPTQARDQFRSIPPERLLPLLRMKGAAFYSLQVEAGGADAPALAEAGLIDLTEHIHDFADTAALMAELDLIIAVDTATVHLAGALGRPVWNLLTFVPHWPWGLTGETTPWYPTMRLFRQTKEGDWDGVLRRAAKELELW